MRPPCGIQARSLTTFGQVGPLPPIPNGRPVFLGSSGPVPSIPNGEPVSLRSKGPLPPIPNGRPVFLGSSGPVPSIPNGEPVSLRSKGPLPPILDMRQLGSMILGQSWGPMSWFLGSRAMPPVLWSSAGARCQVLRVVTARVLSGDRPHPMPRMPVPRRPPSPPLEVLRARPMTSRTWWRESSVIRRCWRFSTPRVSGSVSSAGSTSTTSTGSGGPSGCWGKVAASGSCRWGCRRWMH